jgi:hypothetical protein
MVNFSIYTIYTKQKRRFNNLIPYPLGLHIKDREVVKGSGVNGVNTLLTIIDHQFRIANNILRKAPARGLWSAT